MFSPIQRKKLSYRIWFKLIKTAFGSQNNAFRLLEIGCGRGFFLSHLENIFPKSELYGIDIDSERIAYAKTYLNRAHLYVQDGQFLPYDNESMDVVCAFQVIEHFPEPCRFFNEAYRVLKIGGIIFLSTPNPFGLAAKLLGPRWQGHHSQHISVHPPLIWKQMLIDHQFTILMQGTTGLSGFKVFNSLPLGLLNWIPLYLSGCFRWQYGESFVVAARKNQ